MASRSTGCDSPTWTREKSKKSVSSLLNRSLSRTISCARNLSSSSAWTDSPSCSTDDRMDANGFLISCASEADNSATASKRSARRFRSSSRIWSEMSVKIAVTDPSSSSSASCNVVVTPMGIARPPENTLPVRRMRRRRSRWAIVIPRASSVETPSRNSRNGRPKCCGLTNPSNCSAAGLANASLPAPSTVMTPATSCRRMSEASRRNRLTSCSRTDLAAPTIRTRLAR